jgi:hypothetical protein
MDVGEVTLQDESRPRRVGADRLPEIEARAVADDGDGLDVRRTHGGIGRVENCRRVLTHHAIRDGQEKRRDKHLLHHFSSVRFPLGEQF